MQMFYNKVNASWDLTPCGLKEAYRRFGRTFFTIVYSVNFYKTRRYPIQEGRNCRLPWSETSKLARLVQVSARKAVLNVHLPPEPVTWTGHPPHNMQVRNASRKFFRR